MTAGSLCISSWRCLLCLVLPAICSCAPDAAEKLVVSGVGLGGRGNCMLSGSRGGVVWVAASAVVIPSACCGVRRRSSAKVIGSLRLSVEASFSSLLALVLMVDAFPQVMGPRWALYRETISPYSPDSRGFRSRLGLPPKKLSMGFLGPRLGHWAWNWDRILGCAICESNHGRSPYRSFFGKRDWFPHH